MQYWVEYAILIYFKILFVFWKACQDPPIVSYDPLQEVPTPTLGASALPLQKHDAATAEDLEK